MASVIAHGRHAPIMQFGLAKTRARLVLVSDELIQFASGELSNITHLSQGRVFLLPRCAASLR